MGLEQSQTGKVIANYWKLKTTQALTILFACWKEDVKNENY